MGATYGVNNPRPQATLAQVADHIDHVREVAGIDHVGIGADYDGTDQLPDRLEDVSCYPALVAELLYRGWSEDDCARLSGGNILRVLREAEHVSRVLTGQRASSLAGVNEE
jgi:membrane dipeptidase